MLLNRQRIETHRKCLVSKITRDHALALRPASAALHTTLSFPSPPPRLWVFELKLPDGNGPWHTLSPEACLCVVWKKGNQHSNPCAWERAGITEHGQLLAFPCCPALPARVGTAKGAVCPFTVPKGTWQNTSIQFREYDP